MYKCSTLILLRLLPRAVFSGKLDPPQVHGQEAADASREDADITVAVAFPSVPKRRGTAPLSCANAEPEGVLEPMQACQLRTR